MDETIQRELFRDACGALGGSRPTARILDISERTIMRFISGESQPNSGVLTDLCKALVERAHLCRELEAVLNPLFEANRIPGQRDTENRGRGARDREA